MTYKITIKYQLGGTETHHVKTKEEVKDALDSWRHKESFIVLGNQLIDRDLLEDVIAE